MPEVRGVIIDFFNDTPFYYQARNQAETLALHKVYEALKHSEENRVFIKSLAMAYTDNDENAFLTYAGDFDSLLQALAGLTSAIIMQTEKPDLYACVFVDCFSDAMKKRKKAGNKKNPLK